MTQQRGFFSRLPEVLRGGPARLAILLIVSGCGGGERAERLAGVDEGRVLTSVVADLSVSGLPRAVYEDRVSSMAMFGDWLEPGGQYFAGDFVRAGYDQLLLLNPDADAASGRVMIADFRAGPPARLPYREQWGQHTTLDGWQDPEDLQLVGDFLGLGYDQLLLINRDPRESGGRVMIADFTGGPPARMLYREAWGEHTVLDGWHDAEDLQLVGDFMGLGRDQLLLINRDPRESGGRVMIADFEPGPPAQVRYWEEWGQHRLLEGWHDAEDLQLVGDFMGMGHDQVLFINRDPRRSGGRMMVADFRTGPPGRRLYVEHWGQHAVFDGWDDADDLLLVGDFMGLGHDQVLLVEQGGRSRPLMLADLRSGPPAGTRRLERPLPPAANAPELLLSGDFAGLGRAQLLRIGSH